MAVTARLYIGRLARWLWPGEPLDQTSTVMAWAAAVLGILVPLVVLLPVGPLVKTLAVLVFTCAGPGAAIVCRVRLGNVAAAWAVAMVLSLSTNAALAALMAWTRLWHPLVGFVLLGLATTAASAPILARRRWWPEELPPMPEVRDATTVIPRILDAGPDATTIMPRISADTPLDSTTIIPVIGGDDGWLTGAPAGEGDGWLTGSGTHPALSAVPTSGAVWPAGEDGAPPAGVKGWPVAGARPPDETTVLPVVRDGWLVGGGEEDPGESAPHLDELGPLPSAKPLAPLPLLPERPRVVATLRPAPKIAAPVAVGSPAARVAAWGTGLLTRRNLVDALPLVAGLTLWIIAINSSSTANVGDYGLLSTMHPTFFAAVLVCAAGFVIELYRRDWRWPVLLGYLVLLLLILHATTPLLLSEPEYAWVYKHVGVVEYIRTHGAVDNPKDLYLQWPTFFALGAQVVSVTGVGGLALASWAPLLFDALNCLPLFAIARTLSPNRRVPFLTVFLFTAVNWVGQDYFAPQAFAFVLCLGTLLIMLRWLRRVAGPGRHRPPRQLARLWAWLQNGVVELPYSSTRTRNLALGALYFSYAIVASAHQLSPYVVAMGATALVVVGLIQPLRIVPILLGIAILYLLPRHQVADNYGIFSGFNFFHNATGDGPRLGTTAGRVFSSHVVQLVAVELWGLAALAVVDSRRKLGLVAVPAVLGFSPFALLAAQSYGGEAIYRVYLFTAPWCAFLVAAMVLRWRWMPRAAGMPVAAVALAGAMLACLQGEHGQLVFDQFKPSEVQAANFIYTKAPPHSTIVLTMTNFPSRITAQYPEYAGGPNSDVDLIDQLDLQGHELDDKDLPTIEDYFRTVGPEPAFLVISPSMEHYAHFFGYLPDGAMENLRNEVGKSSDFSVFYRNQDTVIYLYVGLTSG